MPSFVITSYSIHYTKLYEIEALGQDARNRGFADAAGTGKQEGVMHAILVQQCRHQVGRFDKLVVPPHRKALGLGKRLLEISYNFV